MGTSNQDQELIDRIESIKTLIQKKATREVTLIAVTKGFGYEAISAAQKAGLKHFGENYAQELLTKSQNLHENYNWHFIGQLQTNKVKKISNLVKVWHSVTSIKLAKEINPDSNLLIASLQNNISFHDVNPIKEISGTRNAFYIAISCNNPIWKKVKVNDFNLKHNRNRCKSNIFTKIKNKLFKN